jgi:hypothetical protein
LFISFSVVNFIVGYIVLNCVTIVFICVLSQIIRILFTSLIYSMIWFVGKLHIWLCSVLCRCVSTVVAMLLPPVLNLCFVYSTDYQFENNFAVV